MARSQPEAVSDNPFSSRRCTLSTASPNCSRPRKTLVTSRHELPPRQPLEVRVVSFIHAGRMLLVLSHRVAGSAAASNALMAGIPSYGRRVSHF
jgi:hypothetical protein